MNAEVIVLTAAKGAGARVAVPEPAAPLPTVFELEAQVRDSLSRLAENLDRYKAALTERNEAIEQGTTAVLEALAQIKEASAVPLTVTDVAGLLAEVSAKLGGRLDLVQAQIGEITVQLLKLVAGQAKLLAALNAPVVPEYDDSGRVVAARRIQGA